jgi:hypothetical protein
MASQGVAEALKESILSMPITKYSSLEDLINDGSVNGRRLQPRLEQWKTLETLYLAEEFEVEVTGYLNLRTLLRQAIMKYASKIRPKEPTDHSGLIIDSRGLDYSPVLLPQILDSDGYTIISVDGFSRRTAQIRFPVLYVSDPGDPRGIALIGAKPSMVRAQGIVDGDLQVHSDDMTRMPSKEDLSAIIATGRIVIVTD